MQHPTFRRGIAAAALLVSATLLAQQPTPPPARAGIAPPAGTEFSVQLPELKVAEVRPWLYAEVDGYRVLSLCPEKQTRAALRQLQQQLRAVPALLSPKTRATPPVGPLLILTPKPDTPSKSVFRAAIQSFSCEDSFVVFHEVDPEGAGPSTRSFEFDPGNSFLVSSTIGGRSTLLAIHLQWLLGRSAFCADFSWYGAQLPAMARWFERASETQIRFERPQLFLRRIVRTKDGRTTYAPLIPLEEFFRASQNPSLMSTWSVEKRGIAVDQNRLFAYWGALYKSGRHRVAYHAFFDDAGREPITEALFRRHFGLTFGEAETDLHRALRNLDHPETIKLPLRSPPLAPAASIALAPATPAEIRRALGEAYALAGERPYSRKSKVHHLKARSLLEESARDGDTSSELLGQLGLLEYSNSAFDPALKHFEAALAAGNDRPRSLAYTALLRLAEGVFKPAGANRKLSAEQTAHVLRPIALAQNRFPEMEALGRIVAETLLRSEVVPSREQLAALHDSAHRFRYRRDLARSVSRLHQRHGLETEAAALEQLAKNWTVAPPRAETEVDQLFDDLDLFKPLSASEASRPPAAK